MSDPRSTEKAILQRVLAYLAEERQVLVESYCSWSNVDNVMTYDVTTLDADGKPYVEEIDALIRDVESLIA